MMTFANVVGRLVEIRAIWPGRIEDAKNFASFVDQSSAAHPSGALVLVDARQGGVMPQSVFNAFMSHVEVQQHVPQRVAVILADSAIMELQLSRMQKQVHRGEMRNFHDPATAIAWLGEVATEAELRRMLDFVATAERPGTLRASA